jgi:phosphatidylglycerol---prolipoprotein diacylglyceryl transferase
MYPDLSYILHALIGTQPDNIFSIVKTFGLFLVFAILSAAFLLAKELKRKEDEGLLKPVKIKVIEGKPASVADLALNGLFGFILGFKFFYIFSHKDDFIYDPASVVFSTDGNWMWGIILALVFAGIKFYEKNKKKLPKPVERVVTVHPYERMGDITVIAAVSGILGAKIFALAEDVGALFSGEMTFSQMMDQFFSGSGLAIYGGLIVAFFAVSFYVKKKGIAPIHVMDAIAPALLIAYGIGRLGCHFSGDGDWGIVNLAANPGWLPDWLWAFDYPHNVIDSRQHDPLTGALLNEQITKIPDCTWRYCTKLTNPVWPTSVYEFLMMMILGGSLWVIRKKVKIAGMLFFIYLIMNGFERFWIEKIRVNPKNELFGMQTTQAEFIAVLFMLIGIIGCVVLWRRSKKLSAS